MPTLLRREFTSNTDIKLDALALMKMMQRCIHIYNTLCGNRQDVDENPRCQDAVNYLTVNIPVWRQGAGAVGMKSGGHGFAHQPRLLSPNRYTAMYYEGVDQFTARP